MKYKLKDIIDIYKETFYTEDDSSIALIAAVVIGSKLKIPPVWIYLIGPSSGGKSLDGEQKVLCYDGMFKKAKDVIVGDLLMGDDSQPRKVLATHSGKEMMYKIKQQTGDDYVVNESHILTLKATSQRTDIKPYKKGDIIDIELRDLLKKSNWFKSVFKGYKVPVDFKAQSVSLDPYFLGIYLGDGHLHDPAISKPDIEIKKYIETFCKKNDMRMSTYIDKRSECPRYGIVRKNGQPQQNKIWKEILKYEFIKKGKYIPHEYKANTREVRLQILAGLMDTDGYLDRKRGRFEFCNKSKQLADDVVFLARSLGFSASNKKTRKGIKSIGFVGTYWRVQISGPTHLIPTKIKRKQAVQRTYKRDVLATGIKIKKLKKGRYYGFKLDGNGRFLLSDFTVTHNSELVGSFMQVPFITQVSDLTPNTFLSGMSSNYVETSLLKRLGLNFVITMKDFTTILSKSQETQEAIISQMREIYDGYLVKYTGTGNKLEWGPDGKATFIMASTEGIYSVQEKFADMGTRAINYVLMPQHRIKTTKRALKNNNQLEAKRKEIQAVFAEYVKDMTDNIPDELPALSEELEDQIIEIADFSSICRSPVIRDYRGAKSLALSAEMPMRMAKQLLSTAQIFTYMNDGVLSDELKACVFKIGLDSIPKQRRIILEAIASYERVTVSGLSDLINYPPERCTEWIEDLQSFGVCVRTKTAQKQFWKIKDEYRKIMVEYLGVKPKTEDLTGDDGNDSSPGNYADTPIEITEEVKNHNAEMKKLGDNF